MSAANTTVAPAADIPAEKLLVYAAKIALEKDKPICLDYYIDTKNNVAFLGEENDTKERMLVKNPEEFTSPIQKLYKSDHGVIVETENSLYIVHSNIKKKTISSNGF
jgi:hypothetical protein